MDDSISVGDLSDMESDWDPCEAAGVPARRKELVRARRKVEDWLVGCCFFFWKE